jgi:hypothetical protein
MDFSSGWKKSWEHICRVPLTVSKISFLKYKRHFASGVSGYFQITPNSFILSLFLHICIWNSVLTLYILPDALPLKIGRLIWAYISMRLVDCPKCGKIGSLDRSYCRTFSFNLARDIKMLGDALTIPLPFSIIVHTPRWHNFNSHCGTNLLIKSNSSNKTSKQAPKLKFICLTKNPCSIRICIHAI